MFFCESAVIRVLSCAGVYLASYPRRYAAKPATCGAAMDVPDTLAYTVLV